MAGLGKILTCDGGSNNIVAGPSCNPYSVRTQENTDQKKLRIWTLFT